MKSVMNPTKSTPVKGEPKKNPPVDEQPPIDDEIDEAVEDSFPASDPPSTSMPSRRARKKEDE